MYTHHKFDHEFEGGGTTPTLCYVVCATPRCGSSLLCELLCFTGLAGAPTEFFDREMSEEFGRVFGTTTFEDYVATLLRKKTSPNGVFGFKLHRDQYREFFDTRDIRSLFPDLHAVLITRQDKAGQAISFSRAAQSGQWAHDHPVVNHRVRYDREEIQRFLTKIQDEEQAWEQLFTAHAIQPVRVVYEDLVHDPVGQILAVLRGLGIEAPDHLTLPPPTLKQQADRLTARWRRRFLNETSGEPADTQPHGESGNRSSPLAALRARARRGLGKMRQRLGGGRETRPHDARVFGVHYLDHDLPERLPAGARRGVRVTLENTGDFIWRSHPPEGDGVDLTVSVNGEWVDTHKLPRAEVAPGERVTVHFPLEAPAGPGPIELSLDLIQWTVTHFRERGALPLVWKLQVEPSELPTSAACFRDAARVNPWHYAPTRGILRSAAGQLFPLFIAKSRGCRIQDMEGKDYVDYAMGRGSALLGHAPDRVLEAVRQTMEQTGPTLHMPHPLEIEVSELLTEAFPCAEMAVFGKNGSDACTVAARLARAFTGRDHVLYRGYHGWQDFWAEQPGYADRAIPRRPEPVIHEFRYHDLEDFHRVFDPRKDRVAAVMMELYPWGGDTVGFESRVDRAFLEAVARATRDAGALLIYDETVTGFRHREGSVQQATGVVPDLACIGKALAAGFPLSAVVGRAEVMKQAMPQIFYAGPTFRGDVYSLAAARAAMQIYRDEPVSRHVYDHGEKLRAGIHDLCGATGVDATCEGPPFRMAFTFHEPDQDRFRLKRTLYVQELLEAGIAKYNGIFMLPSYAHDHEALAVTLEAVGRVLETVAKAERNDDFDRRIEIPPVLF